MRLLTAEQIDRVYDLTDALGLKRLAVIVPLPAAARGSETLMPDGGLLLCAPYGERFAPWLAGLRERLVAMGLARVPRMDQLEPARLRVAQQPQGSGMRRYGPWNATPAETRGQA